MASTAYPKWKQELVKGTANTSVTAGTLTALLIDSADYSYSDAHEFVTSVPSGARISTVNLTNVTVTTIGSEAYVNCDDFTFPLVSGDTVEAMIIYINTGVEGTSRLWLYIDNALGLPYTPVGTNVPVIVNENGLWKF